MELLMEKERQTPQQQRFIDELKNKSEVRKLKMLGSRVQEDYYLEKKPADRGIREMTESMSFSMAFIFSFFMAGLTGYYVGNFFLEWSFAHSMILALIFIILTIIVETTLFILRQYQKDSRKKKPKTYVDPAFRKKITRKQEKGVKDKRE
jgi:cytochrome c biogenesis protein CcdA